jgi:endo-1,4-beta-D-glucanase Y
MNLSTNIFAQDNYGIPPNHKSKEKINEELIDYYKHWKREYLKPTIMEGGYYVEGHATNNNVESKGTSEGHGFGMIILALMSDFDTNSQHYFDGLYRFFDTHRSQINPHLMGWLIAEDERADSFNSATDGDLDIAYSLLIAHNKWGSDGEINYFQAANDIISKGLKVSCIDSVSKRILLGDWDTNASATRSSDWMPSQMRAFAKATNDDFWIECIDTVYSIVAQITKTYSPNTGLMPDFVTGTPARPVESGFLERTSDGDFSWNACRYPWRIASDYIHYGNKQSFEATKKLVDWAIKQSENDPNKFTAVYKLDGTPIESYTCASFTGPIVVAATIEKKNQEYVNKGWDYLVKQRLNYYDDNIALLSLLMISRNWKAY